jgi:maltose alpha-D-glucosyltransferase/alpha-amylase
MTFINVDNPKVLAFTRSYKDETLLIVVNLSKFSQAAELNLNEYAGYIPYEAFSRNPFPGFKGNAPYFLTLGPHSYHWFILEKTKSENVIENKLPLLKVNTLEDLWFGETIQVLENLILPDYLPKTNWFIGKKRTIYSIHIKEKSLFQSEGSNIYFLIIEVAFESGLPENYFFPLVFETGRSASNIRSQYPEVG